MKRAWSWTRLERADVLLPLALAVASVVEVVAVGVAVPIGVGSSLLVCLLLVGRRRQPLVFATAAGLVDIVRVQWGVPEDLLVVPMAFVFVSCYSLGRYVRGWSGLAGIAAMNLAVHLAGGEPTMPDVSGVLWVMSLTVSPWVFGRLVNAHARSNEVLERQARQLVEDQRLLAERAVLDERRRIARELHDVIAHSLSVMVVQAGAAADVLGSDPDRARRFLDEIGRAGRTALDETGRLLHLLREESDGELVPQPAAADLPRLVESFRSSGLSVDLVVEGPTQGLPAGVDLSVFRIVQEGLTNALKHAPDSPVSVVYRRQPDGVDVEMRSGAGRQQASLPSQGRGLIGMRERVAVFGGDLEAAATADGGFHVRARLPVPGAP